jgi:hypothetical protein
LFRLALALGRTVGELERDMSHGEFVEWQVFARSWPFGEKRLDILFAQLCHLIASALGNKTSISDWMLRTDPAEIEEAAKEPITDDDLRTMFGANVRRIK